MTEKEIVITESASAAEPTADPINEPVKESADQIISIFWNQEHRCYQVFWRVPDDQSK